MKGVSGKVNKNILVVAIAAALVCGHAAPLPTRGIDAQKTVVINEILI